MQANPVASWATMLLAALLALLAVCTAASESSGVAKIPFRAPKHWTHANVLRTVDLSSSVVRETVSVVAQNIHKNPVSEYYLTLHGTNADKLAHITATEKKSGADLKIELEATDSESLTKYYKITLNAIASGEKVTLTIRMVTTHVLTPLPKEIGQVAPQFLVYEGNVFFFTPYESEKQKINVRTPTEKVASFSSGEGVTRSGNTITYGPYPVVKAFMVQELRVHFENTKAVLIVPTLTREFQISHWLGEANVQEDFFLRNGGARLKGQFSRLQYQQTKPYHSSISFIGHLSFKFPAGAHSAYFKDDVGNVSTSNFRESKSGSVLEIRPRYPIFGGWNYTWFHGYTAPIDVFLRQIGPDKYMLKVPFVENLNEMTVDKVVFKVILPEGARDIKVLAPFPVDVQTITFHHTYFSSTGHPLVTLEKFNVVREHSSPVLITYTYSFWANLRKPFVTSGAISLLFIASMVWSRIPKSIGTKKPHATHHHSHHHHKKSK